MDCRTGRAFFDPAQPFIPVAEPPLFQRPVWENSWTGVTSSVPYLIGLSSTRLSNCFWNKFTLSISTTEWHVIKTKPPHSFCLFYICPRLFLIILGLWEIPSKVPYSSVSCHLLFYSSLTHPGWSFPFQDGQFKSISAHLYFFSYTSPLNTQFSSISCLN